MLGRTNRRRGLTVLVGMTLAAASVLVGTSSPAQAATAITINGTSGGRALRRRRRDQRRRRQQPPADRLSGAAAQPDPGLPVQARLRRRAADPQGGDRRRHQLHLRRRAEPRAHPRRPQLQPRLRVVADGAGQGPQPEHQAGRAWPGARPAGSATATFFSNDMIDYLVAWLGCATQHGLTIDYLGGWNEKGCNITWYENLRSALNSHGFGSVKIVAGGRLRLGCGRRRRCGTRRSRNAVSTSSAATTSAGTAARRPTARAPANAVAPASRCGPARTARTTTTPARRRWPAASTAATSTAR